MYPKLGRFTNVVSTVLFAVRFSHHTIVCLFSYVWPMLVVAGASSSSNSWGGCFPLSFFVNNLLFCVASQRNVLWLISIDSFWLFKFIWDYKYIVSLNKLFASIIFNLINSYKRKLLFIKKSKSVSRSLLKFIIKIKIKIISTFILFKFINIFINYFTKCIISINI